MARRVVRCSAAAICGLIAAIGCSGRAEQSSATRSGAGAAPAAETNQVLIDNFEFKPRVLTVPLGAKVTWTNRDDVPHTATSSDKPRSFDSGALDTDAAYSFVFDRPGTYAYFCAIHTHMTGEIVVTPAGGGKP